MSIEEKFNDMFTDVLAEQLFDGGFVELAPNMYIFKLQDGPIKEVGKNGCQIEGIVEFCAHKLRMFDAELPSVETRQAIKHLDEASAWLVSRTKDREHRGVEGTNVV